MKTTKFIVAGAILLMGATSCVENSKQYQSMVAERDSIQREMTALTGTYDETLGILNEVENGLSEIRKAEGQMSIDAANADGMSKTKRQQLASQVKDINDIILANKEKIARLQTQLSKSNNKNATLVKTIERLEQELNEKSTLLAELQDDLAKKNIMISDLNTQLGNLSNNVAKLNEQSAKQQAQLDKQDKALNTVMYCVKSSKELKEANIVLSSKNIMNKDFNKGAFKESDLRELKSVPTNSKRPKVMTMHPQGSYEMVVGEDKLITLEIKDPAKFWSVSKYLVIKI